MRILVMGGASLLGSHLSERLVGEGHEVIAVDDFTTGSFATLAHLKHEPRFAFVEHDVTRRFAVHVDAVFQLAVPSSRRACEGDPVRATITGVMGTMHALELAADHRARIVLATSPERWGQGVRCAEALTLDFARTRDVDARVVRVASTYGPRMSADDPHIVVRLALQALSGEVLDAGLRGDAPLRLAFVGDAVQTLALAMASDLRVPPVESPFVDTNVDAVARAIRAATSREELIAPAVACAPTLPPPSMCGTTPEAMPASLVFGQDPACDLDTGIRETVHWLEQRLGRREGARESGLFGAPPLPVSHSA